MTAQLHMRQGPGTDYGLVGGVYAGDKVTITGRSPAGDWWQIETSAGKEGWVAAGYVQAIEKLVARLPVITVPRRLLSSTPHPPEPPSSIDVNGASVAGSLSPAGEQQYVFTEKDRETLVILKFRPNVNLNGDPVQFSILYTNQIGQIMNVGSGSRPARDQDGDLNTGELVWRGGSLVPGSEYYLRLVNNSPTPVDYCLDFREDTSWNCR